LGGNSVFLSLFSDEIEPRVAVEDAKLVEAVRLFIPLAIFKINKQPLVN